MLGILVIPAQAAYATAAASDGGGGNASTGLTSNPATPDTSNPLKGCAKNDSCGDPATNCNKNNCDLIAEYINPFISLLAAAFGTIAVISIILGGIQYITSEGDPQKTASSKRRITNTIVALIAFLFLYAFLEFLIPGGVFNR